jgi:hypothetical protein
MSAFHIGRPATFHQPLQRHWPMGSIWEESILGCSPPSTMSFRCLLIEYPWNGFSIEHISHNKIRNEYRSTDLLYVLSLATARKMEH